MFIKFDKPKTNSRGRLASSGSSSAFVNYLKKEDEIHIEQGEQPEQWFSNGRDECHPAEVRASILLRRSGKPWEIPRQNGWRTLSPGYRKILTRSLRGTSRSLTKRGKR